MKGLFGQDHRARFDIGWSPAKLTNAMVEVLLQLPPGAALSKEVVVQEHSRHERPPAAVAPSVAPIAVTSPPRLGRRPRQEPRAQLLVRLTLRRACRSRVGD